ncbi:hypothetical protein LX32DRAFT_283055 [Colletotrichum zoysiae]|uniref:Uncharacterized protein n=1 Tax=Colletotrichum zoysiae TaxID=1216348 RepID=A0AAD9HNK2_9PEZI|nr:hypothetical protein LX32DRAFT_283055 [Colletotrichum zoysiae]
MKPGFSCAAVFQLATLLKPTYQARTPGQAGDGLQQRNALARAERAGERAFAGGQPSSKESCGGREMPTHQTKQRGTAVIMAGHPSKSFAHPQGPGSGVRCAESPLELDKDQSTVARRSMVQLLPFTPDALISVIL